MKNQVDFGWDILSQSTQSKNGSTYCTEGVTVRPIMHVIEDVSTCGRRTSSETQSMMMQDIQSERKRRFPSNLTRVVQYQSIYLIW